MKKWTIGLFILCNIHFLSQKTYAAVKQAVDEPDSASANDKPTVSRISVSMATLSKVRAWSKNDVTDWIEKKGLKG